MPHLTPRTFQRYWLVVIALTFVVEIVAIAMHGNNLTMSEWVWSKTHSLGVKMALSALLVWLFYHFVWSGPRRGLSWQIDGIAVALGALLGVAAYFARR